MQMVRRTLWFLVLSFYATACSKGGFDDAYDRYLSLFGYPKIDVSEQRTAFLGRARLSSGEGAAWAKIYARDLNASTEQYPVALLSNDKGGFLLRDLQPSRYGIFIIAPQGEGMMIEEELSGGKLQEREDLTLEPLVRLSGRVLLKNEATHSGINVYIPNTPFATFTDQNGYFYLDVPKGNYDLHAVKDNFITYSSGSFALTAGKAIHAELEPFPWPKGVLTLQSADPVVVRGMKTTVNIKVNESVRYMRLVPDGSSSLLSYPSYDWQEVQDKVVVTYTGEGWHSLLFQFRDAYGKISDILPISFYNTKLDESWKFLYGRQRNPVTIRGTDKVMLLGQNRVGISANSGGQRTSGAIIPNGTSAESSLNVPSSSDGQVLDSNQSIQALYFEDTVTVEAGATLRGAADFLGSVLLLGTKAKPILWGAAELSEQAGSVFYRNVRLTYVQSDGMSFDFSNEEMNQDVVVEQSILKNAFISQRAMMFNPSGLFSLRIVRSSLQNSYLQQTCNQAKDANSTLESGDVFAVKNFSVNMEISGTELNHVVTTFDCFKEEGRIIEPSFKSDHNNYLALPDHAFYFNAMTRNGGLPTSSQLNYQVRDNYFTHPARLHQQCNTTCKPDEWGELRPDPWHNNVGPE